MNTPNPNYVLREYDNALRSITETGFDVVGDRTGVGTRCLFGLSTEYDISARVPVLTKRRVMWKSIVKEVLWYISGSHNINDLEAAECKIWSPWKTKQFTDKHNLPEGSGGYLYGFNLIHFGSDLHKSVADQSDPLNQGFNQLDYVINTLRNNPKSRQACFTFWRPDTNHMAILPACHAFYSFIVSPDDNGEMKVLNLHITQRSADWFVGVGMGNLWTGALFVYMIAQQLGMKPGRLYHAGAHCHVYNNALDTAREYLTRTDEPSSPILRINHKPSMYEYTVDDFELDEYDPLPKMNVAIAV